MEVMSIARHIRSMTPASFMTMTSATSFLATVPMGVPASSLCATDTIGCEATGARCTATRTCGSRRARALFMRSRAPRLRSLARRHSPADLLPQRLADDRRAFGERAQLLVRDDARQLFE